MSYLNLRVCQDPLEILTALNKMYEERSPVLVWQNTGDKRTTKNCYIRGIDYSSGRLIIMSLDSNRAFEFSQEFSIYIRGSEKSILFKREQAVIDSKRIVIGIPKEVRMYEKRANPRLVLGWDGGYNTHIEVKLNSTSKHKKEFVFNIFDLSLTGAALYFPLSDRVFFNPNDNILIHKLGSFPYKNPLEARVIYIKKIEFLHMGKRTTKMKMGIHFKHKISQEMLRSFRPAPSHSG